jgi:hypothetical protein
MMGDREPAVKNQFAAEVLQELKQEIQRQRDSAAPDITDKGQTISWPAALERVHALARINPHQPVAWPTWPPGLWPKLVAAAQKVTRRLLRWYIDPMVEQQNRYNAAVAQSLDLLWLDIARLRAELPEREDDGE